MWKVLVALVCLAAVVLVVGFLVRFFLRGPFGRLSRQTVATTCIACQGKGWTSQQERTLTFDGEGFVNGTARTHPCTTCGGTGVIHR